MDKNLTVIIAGGDLRQIYLARYLSDYFNVLTLGLEGEGLACADDKSKADILILPIIVSGDDVHLNAPFAKKPIFLSSLSSYLKEGGIVFSGRLPHKTERLFSDAKLSTIDYFSREELTIKNCVPTAEGALQIALEELPITINGAKTLVIGFGRVGKSVSRLFAAVGAQVSCAARKHSDLAWCELSGIKGIKTCEAVKDLSGYDVIINTVPAVILDKEALMTVNPQTLIIDLASKPGGVDFEYAKELMLNVVWALSLPLKVTAANITPQKTPWKNQGELSYSP